MAHKKSKKVWYCPIINHNIMASYCNNKCDKIGWSGTCDYGGFNACKLISENNKKDIDTAWK